MAPLGVWVVLSGGIWLLLATGLSAVVAALEWTRMASPARSLKRDWVMALILSLGAVTAVISGGQGIFWAALTAIATSLIALTAALLRGSRPVSFGFGALYVTFPFGAFIHIREEWSSGGLMLIWLMVLVWTTDIAAFLAGRGFGGPRIAPQKSPNKTWTGALGAFVCTVIAGAALARFTGASMIYFCIGAGVVSVVAQGGDILESWFKRRFGVKDASGVIPGHGGVLDRLDSLMAVVSFVVILKALAPGLVIG